MAFILIAQDDPKERADIEAALRTAGHEVETAPDGRAAVTAFRNRLHDLVITDIFMPELDGLGTIVELRRIRVSLPIIAISELSKRTNEDFLETARVLGAETFKIPFELGDLLTTVEKLLKVTPGRAEGETASKARGGGEPGEPEESEESEESGKPGEPGDPSGKP